MSTIKINKLTDLSDRINTGKVVTTAKYTDTTNVNSTSSTFVTVYTMPTFTKKYDNTVSTVYGFCSISSLFEGSEQQYWRIMRSNDSNYTNIETILHRNSSVTGWGMHNVPLNFWDSNSPAGPLIYRLELQVVTYGYYNYPTNWGNGVSHYVLMEVLN